MLKSQRSMESTGLLRNQSHLFTINNPRTVKTFLKHLFQTRGVVHAKYYCKLPETSVMQGRPLSSLITRKVTANNSSLIIKMLTTKGMVDLFCNPIHATCNRLPRNYIKEYINLMESNTLSAVCQHSRIFHRFCSV